MTQPAWAGMIETRRTGYHLSHTGTQPAWAGMIETRYCLLAMHLLLTQPAWAGMIETSKIGVIEIAENDPARMGWDD